MGTANSYYLSPPDHLADNGIGYCKRILTYIAFPSQFTWQINGIGYCKRILSLTSSPYQFTWRINGIGYCKRILSSTASPSQFTWRIIDIGYSKRITIADQRAAIALAFRMWSEVIPISFREDNEADINKIAIKIGFGQSELIIAFTIFCSLRKSSYFGLD